MRTLSIILLSALAVSSTQFTFATAEESGGGPKLPPINVCGILSVRATSSDNTPSRLNYIITNEYSGRGHYLDEKSIDTITEDHGAGESVCIRGQNDANLIRSAQVVSEQ